ncbi:MAG: DUF2269 domain-containing protein [Actinomycetota bacterium]|nr:DUF2269 domain-containing protein [Actinomycetota bacterium]
MTLWIRKAVLTTHVVSSVGWLGAVAAMFILAISTLGADNAELARAVYLVGDRMGWFVLVPLAFVSLVTGLIVSFTSRWGLLRHYWVLIKLGITVVATVILLVYTKTLAALARTAAEPHLSTVDSMFGGMLSVALHAGAALGILLVATILSIYKPRGTTRFGGRLIR